MQILFAGKAHPRDDAGKALIQQVVKFAQQKEFRRRLVFLEDYDMAVARYLVQGSDIWLNTPLRPLEASGTSGMKALANGGLNLSTLDGWWDEAWHDATAEKRFIGWAIGNGESYDNPDYQDQVESVGALRIAGAGHRPGLLRARRRRPAPPLDRPDEELHFHSVPDVQYAAHGQTVCRGFLCDGQ